MKKNILLNTFLIFSLLITSMSCHKFVEGDPPENEVVSSVVFSDDATAKSAARGMYSLMMTSQSFLNGGLEQYTGLYSDELRNHATRVDQVQFAGNSLASTNNVVLTLFWREAYKYISHANSILEGVGASNSLSQEVKSQLQGEALFIRAFCHFYLVNLFGDIPYVSTTDYRVNSIINRMPTAMVYQRIIEDLSSASDKLSDDYTFAGGKRTQPNKWAAKAMLARVYLYSGDWNSAEQYATEVINQNSYFNLSTNLATVFKANSPETIWELHPVVGQNNTSQARIFIISSTPGNSSVGAVSLTPDTYNSFEPGDSRKAIWTGSFTNVTGTYYFSHKYKVLTASPPTEYNVVLRLAELYLIRSEARARQNKLQSALDDLNVLRLRANLPLIASNDQGQIIDAVEKERRIELLCEFGHRWLDLRRMNRASSVLSPIKIGWQDTDILFPIPQSELLLNLNLHQNDGY